MKSFLALIKKEFLHIIRDVRTLMIVGLMPIVQMLLFGFALNTDVTDIRFGVQDFAKDNLSAKVIQALSSNPDFIYTREIVSKSELESAFNNNALDMVLVFDSEFARNLKAQIILDSSDPNRAKLINMQALQIIMQTLQRELSKGRDINLSPITPHITMLFNPLNESAFNFVPGLLGMVIMLICAMMTSVSIVREKERGSMEILLTSPLSPTKLIISKIVPYFCISCASLVCVLLLSVYVLGLSIKGNILLLLLFCMLYITLALSIGLFISNLAKTQMVAMLVSGMVFIMPIMMLSGMMFPIESMPAILQYISHIIPTKWFIIGVKKIMLEGLGVAESIREWGILFTMLGVILLASFKTFKTRLA